MKNLSKAKSYAVRVDRLTFGYLKKDACFSSASFELGENEKAVLLSGAHLGKSTLARILAGLEPEYIGKVEILGKTGSALRHAYKNVVYLPESPVFFENKSVKDNFAFAFSTLYNDSINLDYVVKIPSTLKSIENIKAGKLGVLGRAKLELERAKLKSIDLLLLDRSTLDIKKDALKRKANDNEVLQKLKPLYRKLISSAKSALVCCENVDDIKYYGLEDARVLYLYMGKIYKFRGLAEFEENILELDALKYSLSLQKRLVKLTLEEDEYYFYETFVSSKSEFLKQVDNNIKKRKIIEKNKKKYLKMGIYEQKCAEIANLYKSKTNLKKHTKIFKALKDNNLLNEDYFVLVTKSNRRKFFGTLSENNNSLYVCSTGEKVSFVD